MSRPSTFTTTMTAEFVDDLVHLLNSPIAITGASRTVRDGKHSITLFITDLASEQERELVINLEPKDL